MTRPVKVNDFIPPFKRKRNYPAECSTGYPVVEMFHPNPNLIQR